MTLAKSFRHSMQMAPKRCASPFLPFPILSNISVVSVASSRSPPLTLQDILPQLAPIELDFFIALDAELDKIEKFYQAREAELEARGRALREQLEDHATHKSFLQVRRNIYTVRSLKSPSLGVLFRTSNMDCRADFKVVRQVYPHSQAQRTIET